MNDERLHAEVQRQIERRKRAQHNATTLLARTAYLGTLGLTIALPIVAGAYLGNWLDRHATGFSFSWTVSLILLGVFVGAMNAFLFVRQTWG